MKLTAGMAMLMLVPLCSLPLRALPQDSRRMAGHPLRTRVVAYRTVEYGVASWYGPGFRNRPTASGVPFDDTKLTAAHRTLPLGTRVKVTNLKNGRSVVVKVTDRGPWVRGRLIDLSRAAADRLGFRHRGVAPVRVAVLHKPAVTSRRSHATVRGRPGTGEGPRAANPQQKDLHSKIYPHREPSAAFSRSKNRAG